MIISPSLEVLEKTTRQQLFNLFLLDEAESDVLASVMCESLRNTENCFRQSVNKYYIKDGEVFFSVYHSGQYCIFLYWLSRQVFLNHPEYRQLADKIYCLNKALNGLDLYYEVVMPEVFHLDHPVGSVMGRATYGSNFTFAQACTVGNNNGVYPVIGKNVQMLSGAKILGQCHIGDNVIVAANAYIIDTDIPENSLVFGSSPNLVIKSRKC